MRDIRTSDKYVTNLRSLYQKSLYQKPTLVGFLYNCGAGPENFWDLRIQIIRNSIEKQ